MGAYGAGSRILSMLLVGLALGVLGLLEPLIRFWSDFHQVGKPWYLVVGLYLGSGLVCSWVASLAVSPALASRSAQRRPVVCAAYYFAAALALAAVLIAAPLLRREVQALQFSVSYWVIYPVLLALAALAAVKLTPHLVQPLLGAAIGYPSGRISRSRLIVALLIIGLLIPLTAYKGVSAERWSSGRPARAGLRSRPGTQPAQNAILITIGGLRADHLGAYGYARPTTPALDSLAGGGALFERCFTQGSPNELALASLFTSLYPPAHAVRGSEGRSAELSQDIETLAEGLRDAGLHCIGLMNGPFLSRQTGLTQGFDEVVEFNHGYLDLFPWRYLQKFRIVAPPDQIPQSTFFRAGTVVDEALRRIRRVRGRPFFLYLNLADAQQPFIPPRRFESAFLSSGAAPTEPEDLWRMRWPVMKRLPEEGALSAADVLRFVDLYDNTLRYVDGEIGRLLGGLASLGLTDRTLVVVTSDRGMEFLEHGQMLSYSELLYDELIHVPLIMAVPGLSAPGRVAPIVRLIDVLPTVHEIFDLPPARQARGQSLLPLITRGRGWRPVAAYSESYTHAALRTADHKIMVPKQQSGGVLCFDLRIDPGESVNLQGQSAACDSLGLELEQMRRGF